MKEAVKITLKRGMMGDLVDEMVYHKMSRSLRDVKEKHKNWIDYPRNFYAGSQSNNCLKKI